MKKLQLISIKDLFHNKKFVVSFSLIVAFVFWLVITIDQNPEREQTFNNVPVSISVKGTVLEELGIDIVSKDFAESVSVTVNGPSYIVSSLKSDDFLVNASLSHIVGPGLYAIDLTPVKNSEKSGYNFLSVSPQTVTLEFDYIDTKQFNVTAQAEGISAVQGLVAETPIISTAEDTTVSIKGPRTEIEKISKVVAVVSDTETLSSTKSYTGQIKLFDSDNNPLDTTNLTISKENVNVSVPIFKKATVSIVPTFENAPTDVFSYLSYSMDCESTVTIKGPAESVDAISSVSLAPINFNDISLKNNTFTVSPLLPDGVKLDENIEYVTVTFDLKNYVEKIININTSEIEVMNLNSTLSAQCAAIKNVRVLVPRSMSSKISSANFKATIDLTGKTVGDYSVISVITSDKSGVWVSGSYNVSVTIK